MKTTKFEITEQLTQYGVRFWVSIDGKFGPGGIFVSHKEAEEFCDNYYIKTHEYKPKELK